MEEHKYKEKLVFVDEYALIRSLDEFLNFLKLQRKISLYLFGHFVMCIILQFLKY